MQHVLNKDVIIIFYIHEKGVLLHDLQALL